MKNPFQYLQDRREAEQAEREREEEVKQETLGKLGKLNLARMGAASQYNKMVMGVLRSLEEVGYPNTTDLSLGHVQERSLTFRVTTSQRCTPAELSRGYTDVGREYKPHWDIGRWCPNSPMPDEWVASVRVSLVFDKRNQPSQFDVRVGGKYESGRRVFRSRRCGLTEPELIAALKRLHS